MQLIYACTEAGLFMSWLYPSIERKTKIFLNVFSGLNKSNVNKSLGVLGLKAKFYLKMLCLVG